MARVGAGAYAREAPRRIRHPEFIERSCMSAIRCGYPMDTTTQSLRFGLGLVLSGLVACGGNVVRADDEGGGGGSGGTTTTTTTATGGAGGATTTSSTTSTTSTSSTSSTTTTTSDVCAPFADEHGLSSVVIRFRNPTSAPVYLPAVCGGARFNINPAVTDPSVTYGYGTTCLQTCEQLWTDPPYACDACAPTLVRVEPGGTREMLWDGTGLTHTTAMPSACYASPDLDGCSRVVAAPSGNYVVGVMSYTQCIGDCVCEGEGVCFNATGGGDTYLNEVALSFPSQSLAELIFQPGTPD
jgi:hypothetical protein